MAVKTCPIKDCGKAIPVGMLMCSRHWFAAPAPLRSEVWRTWRKVKGMLEDRTAGSEFTDAVKLYREASGAAVQFVQDNI